MSFSEDCMDISIFNNYQVESVIRTNIFKCIIAMPKKYDEIKMQLLQSEIIQFIFEKLISDFKSFRIHNKKYTNIMRYPLRNEGINYFSIILHKYNSKNKTQIDNFIYDEMIRNIKVVHLIQNEFSIIKNKMKGNEVLSVIILFNTVLEVKDKNIMQMMQTENAKENFLIAIDKETSIKNKFPLIFDYAKKKY